MSELAIAAGICVVAGATEALLAGRNPGAVFATIRQPRWAPPGWLWAAIGAAYYAVCGFALWRLLRAPRDGSQVALAFIVTLMGFNCAWNYLFFRLRDLRLSFVFYVPYLPLVALTVWSAARVDRPAALALAGYAAYLPYAVALGYRWWRPVDTR